MLLVTWLIWEVGKVKKKFIIDLFKSFMNHEVVLLYYFYYWSVCICWRTARTWCSIQLLLSRLWIYRYLTSNFNPLLLWALSVADEQGNNGSFHKWCIKWNGTAGKCLIFVANKLLNNKLVSCHPLNKDKGCKSFKS